MKLLRKSWSSSCFNLNLFEKMAVSPSYTYQSCGIIQTNEHYVRVTTLLNYSEMELYYKIFHDQNFGGFSTDAPRLFEQLKTHDMEIQALLNQNLISKYEYSLVFPKSGETYSQEFTVNLFYALTKQCVKKFPPVTNNGTHDIPSTFLKEMHKLRGFSTNESLKEFVNTSDEAFNQYWNDVIVVLKNLSYDVKKIAELRTGYVDDNKKFRFALIRAEIALLSDECQALIKTAKTNTLALDKLLTNFNAAVTEESKDDIHMKQSGNHAKQSVHAIQMQNGHGEQDLKQLKERVHTAADELENIMDRIQVLKPIVKFWRDKNIEGDIIVIDEHLRKVKNDIDEQDTTVGNTFSSVSLDIVKIKERMSFHGNDSKFIVSPDTKRDRTLSRTESSKATHV